MSLINLVLPEINKPDKTEDPKVTTALTTLQSWANGNIDSTNLKTEGIEPKSLEKEKLTSSQIKPESIKAASLEHKIIGDEQVVTNRALVVTNNVYSAQETKSFATEYTPSATRFTQVILNCLHNGEKLDGFLVVYCGGVVICNQNFAGVNNPYLGFSFLCPPGKTWKATGEGELKSSYLFL